MGTSFIDWSEGLCYFEEEEGGEETLGNREVN